MPTSAFDNDEVSRHEIGSPFIVAPRPSTALYSALIAGGYDAASDDLPIEPGGDRYGETRQPIKEAGGAIDRVHKPLGPRTYR